MNVTRINTNTIRGVLAAAALLLFSACGSDEPSADPAPSQSDTTSASTSTASNPESTSSDGSAAQGRSLVVFGDSWPFGAHCNGCTPFPVLYAEALDAEAPTEFTNLTEDGGTSDSLLGEMRDFAPYRAAIKGADVIVISIGANDLEGAFGTFASGKCGPPKDLGCFRKVADAWGEHMDAMLTAMHDLRGKRPTAIRVLTQANEADPNLTAAFGAPFVNEQLPQVMAWQMQEYCRVAAEHHDVCLDLRPVLNGTDLNVPVDVNTQEAMQAVADALVGLGLPELDGE